MLNLSYDLWYVKYYLFCRSVIMNFVINSFDEPPKNTDLCSMIRYILFGTLIAALNVFTYGFAIYAFFIYPFIVNNFLVLFSIGSFLGVFVLVIGTLTLTVFTFRSVKNYVQNHVPEHKNPTARNVIMQYIVGLKDKVCVTIKFGDK